MEFRQIYTPGLAHLSYVISGRTSCIVVDPARDVSPYRQVADNLKLPIKAVVLTHLHADFVAGHMELLQIPGVEVLISRKAEAVFPHYGLSDGEEFKIDQLLIKMQETPGHTPESSVFTVSDLDRGLVPVLIFSGDTLLVGDVGRPDLFPYIKEELALFLYHSLRRLEKLGDHLELYPAHGAGSLLGRELSAKLTSTMGTERLYNRALNIHPEEEFIRQLLLGMPEVPDHFSRCSRINRLGPALVSDLPKPKACDPREFLRSAANGYLIVDTRDPLQFCAAHIPGSYALSLKNNFATYAGWVLSPEKPLLLVVETQKDLEAALKGLYSVGLDNIAGYLRGGMTAWAASGLKSAWVENISAEELQVRLLAGEIILVDVRQQSEFDFAHISGAVHVPAPDIRQSYGEWEDSEKAVAFICNTGMRSILAASLMLRHSRNKKIINVMGGTEAWTKMGYPMISTED
jgi:glyoxylase-like metal-dependent hydrolase (beta-lactamase superfamily II)